MKYNFKVVSTGKRNEGTSNPTDSDSDNRTIKEVLDSETGEVVKAKEFFNQEEDAIFKMRWRLQQTALGYMPPKFKCIICKQPVIISVRKDRGSVFFSHIRDSDNCPIKTTSGLSADEIVAAKYNGINESQRHIDLKNKIGKHLQSNQKSGKGIQDIKIEQRVQDKLFSKVWRQPDVMAKYKEDEIALELQLSTTFLSVVVARDEFYRANKTFIIWVFNFLDTHIDWRSTMVKDVYYANKRNVFEFDYEAQRRSEDAGDLVLLCNWQVPREVNGEVQIEWEKKYITLSDLTFDRATYRIFYFDSDQYFTSAEQGSLISNWESQLQKRYQRLLGREQERTKRLEANWEKRKLIENEHAIERNKLIEEYRSRLESGEIELEVFEKNKKYGFSIEGHVLLDSIYSQVSVFKDGIAIVKRNRKYGYINIYGEEFIPCAYSKCYPFSGGNAVVEIIENRKKRYLVINQSNEVITEIEKFYMQYLISDYQDFVTDNEDVQIWENDRCEIYYSNDEPFWSFTNNRGNTTSSNDYSQNHSLTKRLIKVKKDRHFGVFDIMDMVEKIPCEYDSVSALGERVFYGITDDSEFVRIKKDNKWGLCNSKGEIIHQCLFDSMSDIFYDTAIIVEKNGKYGLLSKTGEYIADCRFNRIDEIRNLDEDKPPAFFYKLGRESGIVNILGEVIPKRKRK